MLISEGKVPPPSFYDRETTGGQGQRREKNEVKESGKKEGNEDKRKERTHKEETKKGRKELWRKKTGADNSVGKNNNLKYIEEKRWRNRDKECKERKGEEKRIQKRAEKIDAENGRGNRGNENRVSEHQNESEEMRNIIKRGKKEGETRKREKE